MKPTLRRPSPALVVSMIAVVIASTATATAATLITSKHIKNNTIRGADIRKGAVRSSDIRDRTIRGEDLRQGILRPLQSSARQVYRTSGPRGVAAGAAYTRVVTLTGLEPAAYVIFGKTDLSATATASTSSRCRLAASTGVVDASGRGLRANATPEAHNLQLVATFTAPGSVLLECRVESGVWNADNAKITAIRVGDAIDVEATG